MNMQAHLATGATTVCRAWQIHRRDGVVLGFTDHDLDLSFGGVLHRAGTGLGGQALAQTTGLAVDNSEAMGALSDDAVREADLLAGRYDGATVEIWHVNWANPEERQRVFLGSIGEVSEGGGAFRAELRGLGEPLTQTQAAVFQRPCGAVLGDRRCRVDLRDPAYHLEMTVTGAVGPALFQLPDALTLPERWFERGRLIVLDGEARGLSAMIKNDRFRGGLREVELWEPLRAQIRVGDRLRLEAGCDRRPDTCREKFNNFMNFAGFPHLPSEDWLVAVPKRRS